MEWDREGNLRLDGSKIHKRVQCPVFSGPSLELYVSSIESTNASSATRTCRIDFDRPAGHLQPDRQQVSMLHHMRRWGAASDVRIFRGDAERATHCRRRKYQREVNTMRASPRDNGGTPSRFSQTVDTATKVAGLVHGIYQAGKVVAPIVRPAMTALAAAVL